MGRTAWIVTILICLLPISSVSLAAGQRPGGVAQNPEVTILVYNYAQVPGNSLTLAKREAGRVFRQAEIRTVWRDCPLEAASSIPTCEQLIGPTSLVLRIVTRFQTAPGLTNKQTLGSSLGNYAAVSYKWVQDEAASGVATPSEILGPAIAHEIGHLLLRQPGHSLVGVMRPKWSRDDFQRAPLGSFLFTPQQAEALRAGVAERSKANVSFQNPQTARRQ